MTKKIENLKFEQAMKELDDLVSNLESGNISLDDAIKTYEHGILLKKHCEKLLKNAKGKLEKIIVKNDGTASLEEA